MGYYIIRAFSQKFLGLGIELSLEASNEDISRDSKELSLEEVVALASRVGLEWARAKKQADRYELLKPSFRAKMMDKYDDGATSEAKIRRQAEQDSEYIDFLEKLNQFKGDCEVLRIRYDSYRNLFEAKRSLLSYRKAEMQYL
jgi:hypothetical protein